MSTPRQLEPGQSLVVTPADFASRGSYITGYIDLVGRGKTQQPFKVFLHASAYPESLGEEPFADWRIGNLYVDVGLRPQDPGDPGTFIDSLDGDIGKASTKVAIPEPMEKLRWSQAMKKLAADAATSLLASMCTDEVLDQLTAAAAQYRQGLDEKKRKARLAAAQAESERQQVRERSAAALVVARKRWESLRSEGFSSRLSIQQVPWDKSINDQIGLLLDFLERLPQRERVIGVFSTRSLTVSGKHTQAVLCEVPIPNSCTVKTFRLTSRHRVTITPRTVEVYLTRTGVYMFTARAEDVERELNKDRLRWEGDGDYELVEAWSEIPCRVYRDVLKEADATASYALLVLEQILDGPDFLGAIQHSSKLLDRTGLNSRGQNTCVFCHRPLTDQNSQWRGIGPECWKKTVAAYPQLLTADLVKGERKLPKSLEAGVTAELQLVDGFKQFPNLESTPALPVAPEDLTKRLVDGGWELVKPFRHGYR